MERRNFLAKFSSRKFWVGKTHLGSGGNCDIEYSFRSIWISESVAEIRGFKRLRMEDRDLHFFLESCSLRPSKNLAATFFQESRSAACL